MSLSSIKLQDAGQVREHRRRLWRSEALIPTGKDFLLFILAAAVSFLSMTAVMRVLRSADRGLPYRDRFASGDNAEWVAYGGNWEVHAGEMGNESNERGAKLVTGSAYWEDYVVQADVALRSAGDAGLIARVSDAEQGVDAYKGVYAGLRFRDQSLVLGIADHDWQELAVKPLPSAIVPNAWYHLKIRLKGCNFDAVVNDGEAELARLEISPAPCPERGKAGMRSYDSGGLWKNFQVTKLSGRR